MVRATKFLTLASAVTAADYSDANTLTGRLFTTRNAQLKTCTGSPALVASGGAPTTSGALNKAKQSQCVKDLKIYKDGSTTTTVSMKLSCSTTADNKVAVMYYTDNNCSAGEVKIAEEFTMAAAGTDCHAQKVTMAAVDYYVQTEGMCKKPGLMPTTAAPATSDAFSQSVGASLFGSIGMAAAWLLA